VRHRIGFLATAAATGAIAFSLVSTGALPSASAAHAADEQLLAPGDLQDASAIQQLNDPSREDDGTASPQAASAVAQSQARAQELLAAAQKEAQAATAAQAAAASASAATSAPAAATPAADNGTAGADAYRAYARSKVGSAQFGCLDALWDRESGWRPSAKNPHSTAYGIPQLLTATWAATGIGRTANGYRQVDAGLVYIAAAYGSPCTAWNHSQRTGWY
jgi:hypothetical protein